MSSYCAGPNGYRGPALETSTATYYKIHSAKKMAEREGFEPSVEFPLHLISNQAPSTTRTPLHIKTKFIIPRNGWSGKGEENYYLMG